MKYLLFITTLFISLTFLAQDTIVKQSGDKLAVKITKINTKNVMYKKHKDVEDKQYIMDKVHIAMIKYEDGRIENFNDETKSSKINENLDLRKGLRIGIHVTPGNMVDPDISTFVSKSGGTISGGPDVYYYFSNNIAIKTGVIINHVPDFRGYDKNGIEKIAYINFIGVPLKVAFATGNKWGFYLESGTTVFFKEIQKERHTYSSIIVLQDVIAGVHFSPLKLVSIHAGPSFQFNLGRYILGAQAGVSFNILN